MNIISWQICLCVSFQSTAVSVICQIYSISLHWSCFVSLTTCRIIYCNFYITDKLNSFKWPQTYLYLYFPISCHSMVDICTNTDVLITTYWHRSLPFYCPTPTGSISSVNITCLLCTLGVDCELKHPVQYDKPKGWNNKDECAPVSISWLHAPFHSLWSWRCTQTAPCPFLDAPSPA